MRRQPLRWILIGCARRAPGSWSRWSRCAAGRRASSGCLRSAPTARRIVAVASSRDDAHPIVDAAHRAGGDALGPRTGTVTM
jgi:hypothetical protein